MNLGEMPWHEAFLQTLFRQSQHIQYFTVMPTDQAQRNRCPAQHMYQYANGLHNAPLPPPHPWIERTGIYIHLQGLTLSELGPNWELPKSEQEPLLHLICQSVDRLQ